MLCIDVNVLAVSDETSKRLKRAAVSFTNESFRSSCFLFFLGCSIEIRNEKKELDIAQHFEEIKRGDGGGTTRDVSWCDAQAQRITSWNSLSWTFCST